MTGDDLRRLAMALPEVEERLTWEVDRTKRLVAAYDAHVHT